MLHEEPMQRPRRQIANFTERGDTNRFVEPLMQMIQYACQLRWLSFDRRPDTANVRRKSGGRRICEF
jgi:hypothetical protein